MSTFPDVFRFPASKNLQLSSLYERNAQGAEKNGGAQQHAGQGSGGAGGGGGVSANYFMASTSVANTHHYPHNTHAGAQHCSVEAAVGANIPSSAHAGGPAEQQAGAPLLLAGGAPATRRVTLQVYPRHSVACIIVLFICNLAFCAVIPAIVNPVPATLWRNFVAFTFTIAILQTATHSVYMGNGNGSWALNVMYMLFLGLYVTLVNGRYFLALSWLAPLLLCTVFAQQVRLLYAVFRNRSPSPLARSSRLVMHAAVAACAGAELFLAYSLLHSTEKQKTDSALYTTLSAVSISIVYALCIVNNWCAVPVDVIFGVSASALAPSP